MKLSRLTAVLPVLYVACAAIGLTGCGTSSPPPAVAQATGVVTLDGAPLSGAIVSFIPKAPDANGNAAPSTAGTDDQGKFTLIYGAGLQGALVGEHTVQISKFSGTAEEPGVETLPAKYNTSSELTATVTEAGPNYFEFTLGNAAKK